MGRKNPPKRIKPTILGGDKENSVRHRARRPGGGHPVNDFVNGHRSEPPRDGTAAAAPGRSPNSGYFRQGEVGGGRAEN